MTNTKTGLEARAAKLDVNPYYLGYALETGAGSIKEAYERDGGNHLFMAWNAALWSDQAKAEKVARDFVTVADGAAARHIALIEARLA